MASKAITAVGSAGWISAEKENVLQLLEQEKEEIIYPAQHEIDWLNEHMAEIFSRNQFNVTDVFKTPGKLRGKTPRTARKRNAPDARIPLSDVFSSNARITPASTRSNKFAKQTSQFSIAQDREAEDRTVPQSQSQLSKAHTDSGYHGSSQDEMQEDIQHPPVLCKSPQSKGSLKVTAQSQQTLRPTRQEAEDRRTTEGSFHSAKEEQTTKVAFAEQNNTITKNESYQLAPQPETASAAQSSSCLVEAATRDTQKPGREFENDFDDIGSPSDGSTPDRPLLRKSSLTFASLPAREPLKKSLGPRTSRTSQLDQSKLYAVNRTSYTARQTADLHGASIDPQSQANRDQVMMDIDDTAATDDECERDTRATQLHNKSSTQRLHEKIDLLGKSQPSRLSKSIPSAAALPASQLGKSEVASNGEKTSVGANVPTKTGLDDEDDWIKPLNSPQTGNRPPLIRSHTTDVTEGVAGDETEDDEDFDMRAPELIDHEERMKTPVRMSPSPGKVIPGFGHIKSASTATLASPGKAAMAPPPGHQKTISVSNPPYPTTTPQGSPLRLIDGPLSASKSKLQSIMKTAKGLFTSSAGVSAAAKMETLSPNALRLAADRVPGLYPNLGTLLEDKPLPPSPPKAGHRTRSSAEKEKEEKRREKDAKALHKVDDQLEKAREKEKEKAALYKQSQERLANLRPVPATQPSRTSLRRADQEQRNRDGGHDSNEMAPPAVPSQTSKPSRPTKPTRDATQKPKPQPVAIRVGTLSQRMPISTSSLASNLQETLPPSEPKRPGLTKKTSNASLTSSTSNHNFKTSVTTQAAKPRALLAAERKKEQDAREAQRKLDQKRENERKRVAQQEEARKQEQRQRAEAERKERERWTAEQAKRAAQQQAIEKKRLENARKAEQQRSERVAHDVLPAAPRPPSRLGSQQALNRSLINHPLPTNTAKPAKRPLEDDAGPIRQQAVKYGAASQQGDAKRRRTEDENVIELAPRPTMSGAPIRQSNLGKKPSIFNHGGYAPAPPGPHLAQVQAPSQIHQQPPPPHRIAHPNTLAQYATGNKIPFADAPNPPAHATKTPASAYPSRTLQLVKSSPQYPNGEAIHLPEIPTDSEDEDSDNEGNAFPVPDWATPGHLTDQLLRQEAIDGDAVFGPIAPLKMEEIFAKGNKERLKRMRDRTSSANWAVSGDGLTLEEVRVDREQRERMRREGGWRYGVS